MLYIILYNQQHNDQKSSHLCDPLDCILCLHLRRSRHIKNIGELGSPGYPLALHQLWWLRRLENLILNSWSNSKEKHQRQHCYCKYFIYLDWNCQKICYFQKSRHLSETERSLLRQINWSLRQKLWIRRFNWILIQKLYPQLRSRRNIYFSIPIHWQQWQKQWMPPIPIQIMI